MAASTLTGFNWKNGAAGSYAAGGIITGGNSGINIDWEHHHGSGGVEVVTAQDMDIRPTLSCKVTGVTKGLIAPAFRTSYPKGALELDIMLQYGTDQMYWTIGSGAAAPAATCGVDRLRLSWTENSPLTADFDFLATTAVRTGSTLTAVALAAGQIPYENQHVVVTVASGDYKCIGFDAEIRNNLIARAPAVTRSTSSKRMKESIELGIAEVTYSATVLVPAGIDLAADAPAHNLGSVGTFNDGSTTITSTFTNIGYAEEPVALREREDGLVEWGLVFDCYQSSWAVT